MLYIFVICNIFVTLCDFVSWMNESKTTTTTLGVYSAITTTTAGHSFELISHIVAFNEHRRKIDAVYFELRGNGEVEEVETVDLIEVYHDSFDPNMRQMALLVSSESVSESVGRIIIISHSRFVYLIDTEIFIINFHFILFYFF